MFLISMCFVHFIPRVTLEVTLAVGYGITSSSRYSQVAPTSKAYQAVRCTKRPRNAWEGAPFGTPLANCHANLAKSYWPPSIRTSSRVDASRRLDEQ